MLKDFKTHLQTLLQNTLQSQFSDQSVIPSIDLDIPTDKQNGDFTTTVALRCAKLLRKSPSVIASEFLQAFKLQIENSDLRTKIAKIEIKGAGFINFYIHESVFFHTIETILREKESFGRVGFGKGKRVQIEFVSANPTGPLSIAHARQAAVGDALANIFNFIGFDVKKEFYVNDEGNQINILGRSVCLRAKESLGATIEFPEDHYQGDYIKDMGCDFLQKNNLKTLEDIENVPVAKWSEFAGAFLLDVIKNELNDFGVHFDIWTHQSKVATNEAIEKTLELLKQKDFIYEKEGAVWFKSTTFGDDKDRVVKKSDGQYTYLTPDIVYHKNKFERGFDWLINIWGPDHHGYIPRITAAVQALGKDASSLNVLIVQLATLFRNGQEISMSTRRGQYVSLREVMDEVGVDASRYFFLMRHIKSHLEFDLELAKKQTSENPIFYIQYAHARVYSINAKASELGISIKESGISLLKESEEIDLIKKLNHFEQSLKYCYDQLDPYPLVSYLHELAICFHKFYDCHRVIDENKDLSSERLALVNAVRIVLANGLKLLGLSTPAKM